MDSDAAVDQDVPELNEAIGNGTSQIQTRCSHWRICLSLNCLKKLRTTLSTVTPKRLPAFLLALLAQTRLRAWSLQSLLKEGDEGSVDRNYLFEAYRGAILFSGQTWWKMGLGTAYRTITAPIAEFAGYSLKLLARQLRLHLQMARPGKPQNARRT